jgi:hypothetical protein
MTRRECLSAGDGANLALAYGRAGFAQAGKNLPVRKAKTTKLFKSPQGFPNAISATPEGLWIGEQKLSGDQAKAYKLPEPKSIGRMRLAGRLERQAAEDRDNAVAQHQRHGRGHRLCLDDWQRASARGVPGRYELQADQPPADPARSSGRRWRRLAWRPVALREALDFVITAARKCARRS